MKQQFVELKKWKEHLNESIIKNSNKIYDECLMKSKISKEFRIINSITQDNNWAVRKNDHLLMNKKKSALPDLAKFAVPSAKMPAPLLFFVVVAAVYQTAYLTLEKEGKKANQEYCNVHSLRPQRLL